MRRSKKEIILEIAYNSFVEKGYENTNIRQLCKECKVEPPTIYYYFKSKKGLFFAVAGSLNEKHDELLKEQTFLDRTMEPHDKLFELFKFNLFYAKNNPKDTKFFLRYRLFPPEEITEDLIIFQQERYEERNEIEKKLFDECLCKGLIAKERVNIVRKIYDMFVANHCYDTVMFDYCPTEEELPNIWEYFVKYKILSA